MAYPLLFLLFLLPLVVFPIPGSFFEIPKVVLGELLIEAIFIWSLINGKLKFKKIKPFQLTLVALIFVLSLIQIIILRDSTVLFGNGFRLQGVFLLWNLLALCLVSSQVNLENKLKTWIFLPFFALLAGIQLWGKDPSGRSISFLGQSDAFAATLVFFYPFLVRQISANKNLLNKVVARNPLAKLLSARFFYGF